MIFRRFSSFYGQRSVMAAWATPSPWSILITYPWLFQWSPLAESHDRLLYKLNVWFYSFFLKLVPCTLLSIITCLLIRALYLVTSLLMFILLTFLHLVLPTVRQPRQTEEQERGSPGQEQHEPEDEAGQHQEDQDRQNHQAAHRHSLPLPPLWVSSGNYNIDNKHKSIFTSNLFSLKLN